MKKQPFAVRFLLHTNVNSETETRNTNAPKLPITQRLFLEIHFEGGMLASGGSNAPKLAIIQRLFLESNFHDYSTEKSQFKVAFFLKSA